jgi:transcriptional regulator with XRE-family HTH domain
VGVPVDGGTGRVSHSSDEPVYARRVDAKSEIREFLTSRRARITPQQAGVATYGSRRVPGLRREEVAVLAGVSVPYYTRLERGNMSGVSDSVLGALSRALRLDDAERAHLRELAHAAQPTVAPRRPRQPRQRVRPAIQRVLDAMTDGAAHVTNERLDILASNQLNTALYSELFDGRVPPVNAARFVYLDPRAREFYLDWDRIAHDIVALLRSAAGRNPYDRELSDLVGELSTRSDEFRTYWAAHDVRFHVSGVKHFHHPVVGDITLNYERLELSADSGLAIMTYTAEPGSESEQALRLLGSWAATTAAENQTPTL